MFRDQLRFETGVTVTGNHHRDSAGVGLHRLLIRAVPVVPRTPPHRIPLLIAEMLTHLHLETTRQDPRRQLGQHTIRTQQLETFGVDLIHKPINQRLVDHRSRRLAPHIITISSHTTGVLSDERTNNQARLTDTTHKGFNTPDGEGSKFWLSLLTELRNRSMGDVLIVCCDGLKGLPEAIEAVWPKATVQTCVIHLIRASFRYTSHDQRKKVAAALKPIYTAASVEAAEAAMVEFEAGLGARYPAITRLWRDQWETFTPFLVFPVEVRRVVYTTNMIESINYQLRKVTKNRGHFPNERAALKLLHLAVRNITTERGGEAGTGTWGWTNCLNQLAIYFPERFNIA